MNRVALAPLLYLACAAPETGLERLHRTAAGDGGLHDSRPGATSSASATLIDPPPGSDGLPRNLYLVVVSFPSPLRDPADLDLRLESALGSQPLRAPFDVECGGGFCYAARLNRSLPPLSQQVVRIHVGTTFENGDPLAPGVVGAFTTGQGFPTALLRVGPPQLDTIADCVRVRFRADGVGTGAVINGDPGLPDEPMLVASPRQIFDLPLWLPGARNDGGLLLVRLTDRAGVMVDSPAVRTPILPRGPRVVITEVLANTAGPEGIQEFVEIKNLESDPVSIDGYSVEDAAGADVLPPVTLAPSAVAVIVPSGFDTRAEPELPANAILIRVDARIGRDGIGNDGDPVRLRAPDGTLLSAYGGWIPMNGIAWTGRSTQRRLPRDCDHPTTWSRVPRTPTAGF